jgi:hypothetical protein
MNDARLDSLIDTLLRRADRFLDLFERLVTTLEEGIHLIEEKEE